MRAFVRWLDTHAGAVQGLAGILTVLLALGALAGVKLQIDASARIQREQSARDIYREYLNLSISRPEFSDPDYCALVATPAEVSYESYVEYMLYTAEQAIAADPEWETVFESTMKAHQDYLCKASNWSGYSGEIQDMVTKFKASNCGKAKVCEPVKVDQE
jgi:hypothetical protein